MESAHSVPLRRQLTERHDDGDTEFSRLHEEVQAPTAAGRTLGRLTHPSLPVRFGALLIVAAAAFLFFWSLAFTLLPAALMRGRSGSALLAGGDRAAGTFAVEWLRLGAVNFGVAFVVAALPNLLRTRRGTPLGYWSTLTLVSVAAIVVGTNSFSIQVGSGNKLVPSLDVFARPGPYELVAYVLTASATCGIGRWQLAGRWPRSKLSRLPPEPVRCRQLVVGASVAAVILVITAAWKAARIIAAVGLDP